jgi:hypothetical protein
VLVAIGVGFLDLLTDRWQKLQRQLFALAFLVLYSLFIIMYYYGPDIWTYVPFYEGIHNPLQLMAHPELCRPFEFGYGMFCSVFHLTGLSYYWLTVTIKTLYFVAIWCLLRRLPKRQMFALACIILIDRDLITHENRECLAVTFFIFMVLLMQERKYILAILGGVITISMHKTGFVPVGLLLFGIFFYNHRQDGSAYAILIGILMLLVVIPVQRISAPMLQFLPLPEVYIKALSHHLLLGRQFQLVVLIYLGALLLLNIYITSSAKKMRYTWLTYIVLTGMAVVVVLYPYYFLLARIRSYFVPLVTYYLVLSLSDEERSKAIPYSSLIKQVFMLLILGYYIHFAINLERFTRQLHAPIAKGSTVFQLRDASPEQIRRRQMKIAETYWAKDYMKETNNRL